MSRQSLTVLAGALAVLCLTPVRAGAQTPAPVAPAPDPGRDSKFQAAIGGGWATLLGDCTDCEADTYQHSPVWFVHAGGSINRRTDLGAEIVWVPGELTTGDRIRATFLMAALRFRPWESRGFFLKTGSGMALIRNWLATVEEDAPPLRSKAFALELGAGWEWRMSRHLGAQVYGSQHVAALGDLETSERTFENVVGNFWTVGAAIVIR